MTKTRVRRSRKELIAFYVSEDEKDSIVEAARVADQTISDYCRKRLLTEG